MVTFYYKEKRTYRQLLNDERKSWIIDMEGETAPQQVSSEAMRNYEVIPANSVLEIMTEEERNNPTIMKRYEIIKPLIENPIYITSRQQRLALARELAEQYQTSQRTILRYYFAYLAKGLSGLMPAKRTRKAKEKTKDQKCIEKALNEFFYSPSKMPLHMAYEMMLLKYYKDADGNLCSDHPSYDQFRYYFRKTRNRKKEAVSRMGLGEFQKNLRPLTGAGNSGIENIGFYEMDATIADIYLVSKYDRKPIGRPYVYMAIDVASRLITGIHVGLKGTGNAVLGCIANAAADKVEFCRRYGIDITPEQWPAHGLPNRICTDRGSDFTSDMVTTLCEVYQVEIINLPPYRPDLKGYIEKAFDCIQNRYKPLLHGMGVIEDTRTSNGAPDYYAQACLDLEQFTRILIECVLYYNTTNILNDFVRTPEMARDDVRPFAADVWTWHEQQGKAELTLVDGESLRLMLLPRDTAQVTRFGLKFRWLYYTAPQLEDAFIKGGSQETVSIAYDDGDTSVIYWIRDGKYVPCELTLASKRYKGLTELEMETLMKAEKQNLNDARRIELQGKLTCNEHILNIRQSAEKKQHSKEDLSAGEIKRTREKEGES